MYSLTLTELDPGPGQRAVAAGHGDHHRTRRAGRVDGAEPDRAGPGGQPDPGHPARAAALRAHGRRREVQQLGVAADEHQVLVLAGQLDRADHPVPVLQPDDLELVAVLRVVRQHPLDHAAGRAERDPGLAGCPARPARPRSRPSSRSVNSLTGVPPDRPGKAALGGSAGISSTLSLIIRPAEVTTPTSPRTVARRATRRSTSCAARPAGSGSDPAAASRRGPGAGAGQQAGRRQQHRARVVGHLERHGGGQRRAAALQQHGPPRGAEPLGDVGQLARHHLAQPLVRGQDLGQLVDLRAQLLPLALQLQPVVAGQPAQRGVQDVLRLDVGQVEHRRSAAAWPRRSRRWTGSRR